MPLTVRQAAGELRAGKLSSVELTEDAIVRADRLDKDLGTFLCRFNDAALARAARADDELAKGIDYGPLHGIPVGIKDVIAAADGPTTAQSLVLDPAWGARKDAPVVQRLRAAGAVIVGKTTTLEFAMGLPDPDKPFPIPRNPWDMDRWAGGSSSGTGSGVATGMMLAGLGTDTGASVRMPAAFCGVSGLKPTFSLVPKSGCTPLCYSTDVVGPLARSAWDCAAMLQVIAGHHPSDPNSSTNAVPDLLADIDREIGKSRIGVMRDRTPADSPVGTVLDVAIDLLAGMGAQVVDVHLPLWDEMAAALMITTVADGCAYHHPDLVSRWDDFFHKNRTSFSWGSLISAADYVQAQRVRRVAQRELGAVFTDVDVIITTTVDAVAPRIASLDSINDDVLSKIQTTYWSAVGNPAIAIPMGFVDGLPVSMQIAGRPFGEAEIVRIAHSYQKMSDWHMRVPGIAA